MENLFVGIGASFVAWLIVVVILRPRITWLRYPVRWEAYNGRVWDYAYLRNRQLWRAVDIRVVCRLRVKGLYPDYPDRWATYELELDDDYIPVLFGTLRSVRKNVGRWETIRTGGVRQGFRVRTDRLPQRLLDDIGPDEARKLTEVRNVYYELVRLGSYAEMYFVALASDGFSGTRSAFESPRWTSRDMGPTADPTVPADNVAREETPTDPRGPKPRRGG